MIEIEKKTGLGTLIIWQPADNLMQLDLQPNMKDLNLFSSKLIGDAERLKSCLFRHGCIIDFIEKVGIKMKDSADDAWVIKAAELRQHSEFLANNFTSMLHRCEAFEKNVQVQLAVVSAILLRRCDASL